MIGEGRKGKGHKNTRRRGDRCVQKNKQETRKKMAYSTSSNWTAQKTTSPDKVRQV